MKLLFEVECRFNIGDTVTVEQNGVLVDATITAIVIEIRGEVNVYYQLHSDMVELDCPLVIEEYLANMGSGLQFCNLYQQSYR